MALWSSGLGNYVTCKSFATQTLVWLSKFMTHNKSRALQHQSQFFAFDYICKKCGTKCNLTCWRLSCTIGLFNHSLPALTWSIAGSFIMLNTMTENKNKSLLTFCSLSWDHGRIYHFLRPSSLKKIEVFIKLLFSFSIMAFNILKFHGSFFKIRATPHLRKPFSNY